MERTNLFGIPECYIRTLKAFIKTEAQFGISEVILLPRVKGDSPYSNFRVVVYAQGVCFCFDVIAPSTHLYKVYVQSIAELCKQYSITFKLL